MARTNPPACPIVAEDINDNNSTSYALFVLRRGDVDAFYRELELHPGCKEKLLDVTAQFDSREPWVLEDAKHRVRSLLATEAARRAVDEIFGGEK